MIVQAVKYLEPQLRLAAKAGKQKKDYKLYTVSKDTFEKIRSLSEGPIEAVFTDPTYGKVHSEYRKYWYLHKESYYLTLQYLTVLFISPDALCFVSAQFERGEALDNIGRDVKKTLEEEGDEGGLKVLSKTVDNVRKQVCASISISSMSIMIKTLTCISPPLFVKGREELIIV